MSSIKTELIIGGWYVTFGGNLRVRRYESVKKELQELQMRFCRGENNSDCKCKLAKCGT